MTNYWLKPNWDTGKIITQLSTERLLELGLRGLVLDVDNTLISGKSTVLDERVINWVRNAKDHFKIHLLSNNPSKERIEKIAQQLNVDYAYRGLKPSRSSLKRVLNDIGLESSAVAIIGDRILTDILVGNRQGIYTILVNPIGIESSSQRFYSIRSLERSLSRIISLI